MNNWFITDYKQIQLFDGFMVVFSTSIPCHLYCYWTLEKPWVHRVKGSKRGLLGKFAEYFCYVAWDKFDQQEAGDTIQHSFILTSWPFCETRWFVFAGEVGGVKSPSISPIFEKHNKYHGPTAHTFIQTNHEELRLDGKIGWFILKWPDKSPLKDHLPADTKLLFLHSNNTSYGTYLGLQPNGSSFWQTEGRNAMGHQWAFVGCNPDIEAQFRVRRIPGQKLYLEGYARGDNIVVFTNPIDKTPTPLLSWETIDLATLCPGAIGILCQVIHDTYQQSWGLRQEGSTDNRVFASKQAWYIIGCNTAQKIQFYRGKFYDKGPKLWIWGYILGDAVFYLNGVPFKPQAPEAYSDIQAPPPSNMVFAETVYNNYLHLHSIRQKGLATDIYRGPYFNHNGTFVGLNAASQFQVKTQSPLLDAYLIGYGR